MHLRTPLTLVLLILVAARGTHAQSRIPSTQPAPDRFELGVSIGAWNLNDGGSLWSGRIARRLTNRLSTEIGVDAGRPDAMSPAYRMTTFGLRLAAPIDHNQSRHSVFITGGAAAASGLSYRVSPFAGVGWQSAWAANRLATRIELQVFSRGTGPQDKARVLVGFVVALR